MSLLERNLRGYRLSANDSLRRNEPMNDYVLKGKKDIPQEIIDALLVDFVNYVGTWQGLDYGLYVQHLKEE